MLLDLFLHVWTCRVCVWFQLECTATSSLGERAGLQRSVVRNIVRCRLCGTETGIAATEAASDWEECALLRIWLSSEFGMPALIYQNNPKDVGKELSKTGSFSLLLPSWNHHELACVVGCVAVITKLSPAGWRFQPESWWQGNCSSVALYHLH